MEYVSSIYLNSTHQRLIRQLDGSKSLLSDESLKRYYLGMVRNFGVEISGALNANREGATTLFRSAKWLCESVLSEDPVSAFVQAAVSMEILIGEKDPKDASDISITALLRNRCAYALARNHAERRKISVLVKDIYDVRSKIVHTGRDSLTQKERSLLSELRMLLFRLLSKELTLLKNA